MSLFDKYNICNDIYTNIYSEQYINISVRKEEISYTIQPYGIPASIFNSSFIISQIHFLVYLLLYVYV